MASAQSIKREKWDLFPRIEADLLRADRNIRYFWLRHVPILLGFILFTYFPFVQKLTGLVPSLCVLAVLVHLVAFGVEVHFEVSNHIGATGYTTFVFTMNFLVATAVCATPGRFVPLVWPLYFMYLPIPAVVAPRSVYVMALAMGSPFLVGATWDALGTAPWSESIVLLGIVSLLALLAYLFLGGYGAQLRRERASLEEARLNRAREEQKLAIADDLHDTLGIALAEAALWQNIGKTSSAGDGQFALDRAERRLQDAMHELRAVVATLSDEQIAFSTVSNLIAARMESLCQASKIELVLDCKPADRSLSGESAHQLIKFAEEAASNAIRHGKPGALSVSLSWDTEICLNIKDNGAGFDPSAPRNEGHGLSSLKRRAEALRGKLDIRSKLGEGTEIDLTIHSPP